MKTVTIRNVPNDLYDTLTELAKRNRRSIQQQLLVILERARLLNGAPPGVKAAEMRKKLSNRSLGDTVSEIRSERNR